jgi:hypothetical protein
VSRKSKAFDRRPGRSSDNDGSAVNNAIDLDRVHEKKNPFPYVYLTIQSHFVTNQPYKRQPSNSSESIQASHDFFSRAHHSTFPFKKHIEPITPEPPPLK